VRHEPGYAAAAESTAYLGMYDAKPMYCIVKSNGEVDLKGGAFSIDGAMFFDGLSFVAEQ